MELFNNLPPEEYKNRETIKETNEKRLCKKCSEQLPRFMRIDGKRIDCRKRTYCLNCSPFNTRRMCGPESKFYKKGEVENTSTDGKRIVHVVDKICLECGKIFHQKTRNAVCSTCRNRKQRRKCKEDCVKLKGGKCVCCGYDKNICALEFHHLDPKEKEINIAESYHLNEEIYKELEKCILVCSNCHREIHANVREIPKIENPQELL